jgi:hypothetical protein
MDDHKMSIDELVNVSVDPLYALPVRDAVRLGVRWLSQLSTLVDPEPTTLTRNQWALAWGALRDISRVLDTRTDAMYNQARMEAERYRGLPPDAYAQARRSGPPTRQWSGEEPKG